MLGLFFLRFGLPHHFGILSFVLSQLMLVFRMESRDLRLLPAISRSLICTSIHRDIGTLAVLGRVSRNRRATWK